VAGRHARDYYEASAPTGHPTAATHLPTPSWTAEDRRTPVGSHVHQPSISQGGAQLYSGSIATATPQTFTMASPPLELNGFGVHPATNSGVGVMRCSPAHIHQIGAGFAVTKRQTLVHSRYTFWHRLDEPAPSGSPGTTPPLSGPLAALPAIARIRLPSGFNRAAATDRREGLSPSSINQRHVAHSSAAKKDAADLRIWFARRSSRFSCSRAARRSASLLVVPGRSPASVSALFTHVRNASG
jgi:hypothetical protein